MSDNLWEELLSVIILNSAVRTNLHKGSSHGITSSDVLPVHLGRCNISAFMSTCGTLAWPCSCACLCSCALSLRRSLSRLLSWLLHCSKCLRLSLYELFDLLLLCSGGFIISLRYHVDLGFSLARGGSCYCIEALNLNTSFTFLSFG